MRPLLRPTILLGIACAPALSALVLADEKKAEAPAEEAQAKVKVKADPVIVINGVVVEVAPGAVIKRAVKVVPPQRIIDAQVQQFIQQWRPILGGEYHLIRAACDPSKDQRKQIALDGERALRDAAIQFNEMQQGMRRGRAANPDPRALIEQGLAASVKAHLSEDQAAKYRAEVEGRAEERKRVVVLNLVAKLDQDLILSAEQREKLTASLTSNWSDAWSQALAMLQNGGNLVYPNIPSQHVVPFLDEKQKKVWATVPKQEGGFFGFGIDFMGIMQDDPLEDEDLKAARVAVQEQEEKK